MILFIACLKDNSVSQPAMSAVVSAGHWSQILVT